MSETGFGPWIRDRQSDGLHFDYWNAVRGRLRDGEWQFDRRRVPRHMFDSFDEFVDHIRDIERRFPHIDLGEEADVGRGFTEARDARDRRSHSRPGNLGGMSQPREPRPSGSGPPPRNPFHEGSIRDPRQSRGFEMPRHPHTSGQPRNVRHSGGFGQPPESRAERYARYDREVNAARQAAAVHEAEHMRAARERSGYPLFRARTPPAPENQGGRMESTARNPAAFARSTGRSGAATSLPFRPSGEAARMARASRMANGIAGPSVVLEQSAMTSGRRRLFQRGTVFTIAREELQYAETTIAHAVLFVVIQPMEDLYLCVASHTAQGNAILGNNPSDYVMLYDGDRPIANRPDEATIMAHRRPLQLWRRDSDQGPVRSALLKLNLRSTYDIGHSFRLNDIGTLSERASTQLGLYIAEVQERLPHDGILDQLTGDIELSPRSHGRQTTQNARNTRRR